MFNANMCLSIKRCRWYIKLFTICIESIMKFDTNLVIFLNILLNTLCDLISGSMHFIVSLKIVLHKSQEDIYYIHHIVRK